MSVDFYTEPYFKGVKISFDIGRFNKEYLANIVIGSMIIHDNVQVIIKSESGTKTFCGPQSKQVMKNIKNLQQIDIIYSICDPYTDKNSILNRYSIGKNFSIKFNKDLKKINTKDNEKNGFVDFWYNNQTNNQNKYYKINGGHIIPHFYETNDDYSTAVKDVYNYSLYNKWYDNNFFADHNQEAIYNHTKEIFPLVNTNNIANCKFDCGRTSKTFRRNLCELRCQPNGQVSNRTSPRRNQATNCYDDSEQISYGYTNDGGKYKHLGKGISTNLEYNNLQKPKAEKLPPHIRPLPEVWNTNVDYIQGFDPNIGSSDDSKKSIVEYFSQDDEEEKINKSLDPVTRFLHRRYGQYYMAPEPPNPNRDITIVTIFQGINFSGNYFELSEGYYNLEQMNIFDKIRSIKIGKGIEVVLFNDNLGKYPVRYYGKDKRIYSKLIGPFEEKALDAKLSDSIVSLCITKQNYLPKTNNKDSVLEHFSQANDQTILGLDKNLIFVIVILVFIYFYSKKNY